MKPKNFPFSSFSLSHPGRVMAAFLLTAALWLGGLTAAAKAQGADLLDTGFDSGAGAANGSVETAAVQADGKIIVSGAFTTFGGVTRNRIARVNANGSLDASFDPSAGANALVNKVAMQPDGKIVLGGVFTAVGGAARNSIARLNADGSLDSSFNPGAGANAAVFSVSVQADGKIIIGGAFTTIGGVAHSGIARLNADGSLDSSFNPGAGANAAVFSATVQPDGKIIIGGAFNAFNGVARNRIARLNADGSLDGAFDPGAGADNFVETVTVQPDGKLIVGGDFSAFNGVVLGGVARLKADGGLDASFNPGVGANGSILNVAVQGNGKIVVGGNFTQFNGVVHHNLARVNADGSLDAGFDPTGAGADGRIAAVVLQPDGKIIVGGAFAAFDGATRGSFARLNADPSPSATLLTNLDNRALAAGSTVTLSAAASDFSSGVNDLARVEFYADGALFASFDGAGNPTTSAYGPAERRPVRRAAGDPVGNKTVFQAPFQLPGINKLVNLIVRAVDKLGRTQDSSPVNVQSVVTADHAPLVSLGTPSSGARARVGAPVSVPASVSDPDGPASASDINPTRPVRRTFEVSGVVARVEYFVNQLKVKDSSAAPFGFDFTPPAAGTYVLTAIATDGSGLAKVSEPVVVTAASTVNLSVAGDGIAQEGGAKAKALFSRPGDASGDLTVFYKLKGTAKNGKDFEKLGNSVVIPAGKESVKLKVKAIDNAKAKGELKLTIQLIESPTNDYDLGTSTKAKILLLDND